MVRRRTIAEFMVTELITLPVDMEIAHAVAFLLKSRISGAPVLGDTGEMVGLLTKKDCFRAALNAAYYSEWGGTVGAYMSTDLHTLDAGLDIVSAAEIFLSSSYRRFPVMRDGRLVGLLSRSDLLRAFIEVGFPRGSN